MAIYMLKTGGKGGPFGSKNRNFCFSLETLENDQKQLKHIYFVPQNDVHWVRKMVPWYIPNPCYF